MTYWVGVVSRDHVRAAVSGGFIQLGHGKRAPVERLSPGDWIALYSPRTSITGGETVQAFTAVGRVATGSAVDVRQSPDFRPVRRGVSYRKAHDCPIRPLIDSLEFLDGLPNWGIAFRRSVFAISQTDFERIAHGMGVKIGATDSP